MKVSQRLKLAGSTKRGYVALIKRVESKFGDLADRRTRGIFHDWRDKIAVEFGRR
jgi:hypothetical protein